MGTNGKRGISGFAMTGLAIILALWMLYASAPVKAADVPDTSYIGILLREVLKEGYSVEGPSEVLKVGESSITIVYLPRHDMTIDLNGKKVTVKDSQGTTVSLSSIQPKMQIYACRKKGNVIILVTPKKEASNAQ